jgi:hypothetical protein
MDMRAAHDPKSAIRNLRVTGLAMAGGITVFAAVAWFLHRASPPAPADGPWILYLWIAAATSLIAASMMVWRATAVRWIERPDPATDWQARAAGISNGLVISWALVEGAALFGVVVYFLFGSVLPGLLGVFVMWAALAFTWPQPEWLATGETARY